MNNETKINLLLVEDEPVVAMAEKKKLEQLGYLVHHAATGEKALEIITGSVFPIDLILMDITLSGMNGIETSAQIIRQNDIPVIFLSSETELEEIKKTEKISSYGYVAKGTGITVLDASIKIALKLFNEKTKRRRAEHTIHTQLQKLTQDHEYARRHVMSLLPDTMPSFPDLFVSAAFLPTEIIGGDVLIIETDEVNHMLYAAIADCTGHGVCAALEASKLKALIDHYLPDLKASRDPAQFLGHIDAAFTRSLANNTDSSSLSYPTMIVLAINCRTKTVTLANASGELPFIIGPDKSARQLSAVNGGHLGFQFPGKRYVQRTYTLQPGECFFMVSDAARDVMVSTNQPLGNEGLRNELQKLSFPDANLCTALKQRLDELHQSPLPDDYTAFFLQYELPLTQQLVLHRLSELETAKETISKTLVRYYYSKNDIMSYLVAFNEMYINAVTHGNKNDPAKKVTVSITVNYEKAVITVTDEGDGFNPMHIPDPTDPQRILFLMAQSALEDEDAPLYHGRGIHMTRTRLADELVYNKKGNQAAITKKRTIAPLICGDTPAFKDTASVMDIAHLSFTKNFIIIEPELCLNSQILSKIIFSAANYKKQTSTPLLVTIRDNEAVKNELIGYNLEKAGLITFE